MSNFRFISFCLINILPFISTFAFAQNIIVDEPLSVTFDQETAPLLKFRAKNTYKFSADPTVQLPIDILWERTEWNNPEINFKPRQNLYSVGDINGDGIDDFVKTMGIYADNRSFELTDVSARSLVHFGGSNLNTNPEQVFHLLITPIGDINNDGFDDAFGLQYDGEYGDVVLLSGSSSGYIIVDTNSYQEYYMNFINFGRGQINIDFNQDNISDFITMRRDDNGNNFLSIFLGSNNISSANPELTFYADTIQTPELVRQEFAGYFEKDGMKYVALIALKGEIFEYEAVLNFFKINTSGKFEFVEELVLGSEINSNVWSLFIDDFTGDGKIDLLYRLYSNSDFKLYLNPSSSDSTQLFGSNNFQISDDIRWIQHIGDINSDGKPDLIIIPENDTLAQFGNIQANGNNFSFNVYQTLDASDIIENAQFYTHRVGQYSMLNTKGRYPYFYQEDSIKTFSLVYNSNQFFGNLLFNYSKDNANQPVSVFKDLSYQNEDYDVAITREVFYLGDLENDGIDNFATLTSKAKSSIVRVYNGFDDANVQEIVFSEPYFPVSVLGGNFFGSSEKEILIHIYENDLNQELQFFTLNQEVTPVHTFDLSSININGTFIDESPIVSILGDIDNNGYDEIAISNPTGSTITEINRYTFILKGKESLSGSPDIAHDIWNNLQGLFTNRSYPLSNGDRVTLMQAIGDINSDGYDDFALGTPGRRYENDASHNFSGSVFIHYGNENAQILPPKIELQANSNSLKFSQKYHGAYSEISSGDFDGDGVTDFATVTVFNSKIENSNEGGEAINIYYGKDIPISTPDTTIRLRKEYIYPAQELDGYGYANALGRTLLKAIDVDKDGSDELLVVPGGSSFGVNNYLARGYQALLYEVGSKPDEIAEAFFQGLNPNFTINPHGTYINKQVNSIVGDFTGDGNIEFIGYQPNVRNYRDTPVYLFSLSNLTGLSADEDLDSEIPNKLVLHQNYPNPFNPETILSFELPKTSRVQLTVYNAVGQKMKTVVDNVLTKGTHKFTFDASGLSSGIYFYKLATENFSETRNMILIK